MEKYRIKLKKADGTTAVPGIIATYDGEGNEIAAHYVDKNSFEERLKGLSEFATANDIENLFAGAEQVTE